MSLGLFFVLALLVMVMPVVAATPLHGGVDPARIRYYETLLEEQPLHIVPPAEDRAAWQELADHPLLAEVPARARNLLTKPLPQMTEDLYMQFSRTGERTQEYVEVRRQRLVRLWEFTLAEAIENQGRFLAALEAVITSLCAEPTWVYSFHDHDLANWRGQRVDLDLAAWVPALHLALADRVLGDRLAPGLRRLISERLQERMFAPYRRCLAGEQPPWWWMTVENNWNAVCQYGVLTTALMALPDRRERALYVAAAEKFLPLYLQGLGPDGYCAEGLGYWNYGFGHFMFLCESLRSASSGKIDFYRLPHAEAAARYPQRLHLAHGLWPAYADCRFGTQPDGLPVDLTVLRYGLPSNDWTLDERKGQDFMMCVHLQGLAARKALAATRPAASAPAAQDYFPQGGVLTVRPEAGSAGRLAASFKAGHNDEPHNHNDLGSFVVVLGKEALLVDPGAEVYSRRTFSQDRYQSKLTNSYGHSVPVVAGQLQRPGREARAQAGDPVFTADADEWVLDLTSAYDVPGLQTVRRTFCYDRRGEGALRVQDDFVLAAPDRLASAVITYGQVEILSAASFRVTQGAEALLVEVQAGPEPVKLTPERLDEHTQSGQQPLRIGIEIARPCATGRITLHITPASPRASR